MSEGVCTSGIQRLIFHQRECFNDFVTEVVSSSAVCPTGSQSKAGTWIVPASSLHRAGPPQRTASLCHFKLLHFLFAELNGCMYLSPFCYHIPVASFTRDSAKNEMTERCEEQMMAGSIHKSVSAF